MLVDALTPSSATKETTPFPWEYISIWSALRLFQGTGAAGGVLNSVRGVFWISVQQYTTREIQASLFQHLHGYMISRIKFITCSSLSLKWHLSRRTGEVLRVMDRGTNSVTQLISILLFQIF